MKILKRLSRGQPLQVFLIGVAGLGVGAVLSAGSLLEGAERKPFGDKRDAWISVWEPFDAVSRGAALDRPGNWIADIRGADSPVAPPAPRETPSPTPAVAVTATPPPSSTLSPDTTPSPTATATATPTPAPLLRAPTENEPLRMWVGGDSQAETLTSSLARLAGETGLFATETSFRLSSGLTRPDFFDWPAFLFQESQAFDLEVIVLLLGGNDSQAIQTAEGEVFQRLTDEWRAEYRARVGGLMDLLEAPGRVLVWVGQPVMRDSGYSERMAYLNAIYKSEAAKRPAVLFVDTFAMFVDGEGSYSAYFADGDGGLTLVRQADGVHLTHSGGDILAATILRLIFKEAAIAQD